ncbi:MAG TPA: divergent polysaccharide deacetylase family protein [Verrucomicrobiae bacterium]|nr:divergent polysaccharide deacetylase family protein [Verrucomicrobiae bacterium]
MCRTTHVPAWSLLLCLLAFLLASCSRKPTAGQIHDITSDLVAAAKSAAGPNSQISIRPEIRRTAAGHQELAADNIFINVAPSASGPFLRELESAIDRAAARHHLTRVSRPESNGEIHFDYLLNGGRTHSIHILINETSAAHASSAAPRLAVIIDDMGRDQSAAAALLKLPYPLTFSVLPGQLHSAEIADQAHRRGDQIMLHLPMQFEGNSAKAEPVELRLGMPSSEVDRLLAQMLSSVPYAIGVNNHEGSLATANPQLMSELMDALRRRNLFFIDSRTTAATVAFSAAQRAGVRAASRKVFLDDVETRGAVLQQLELAVRDAQRNGAAIAIGHPHPSTIAALTEGIPRIKSRVRLVFASTLVH